MLVRNAISALNLHSRVLSAIASSNRSRPCSKEPLRPSYGYGSVCADQVPGTAYPLFQAFVEAGQLDGHVSRGHGTNVTTPSASGVEFLYQAIGLTSDRELVSRLAYLWGMSPEVLGSTAGTLAGLLEPCGRDTTPHALWVLVRCPALRYWSEMQLRCSFRQLWQLTRGAQLTDHDFTRALYQHPWMLNAAAATAAVRRTPAAAAPESTLAKEACTTSGPVQQQPPHQQQHLLPTATAYRWIATLLVQAQAYSTRVSGGSSDAPPYVTPAIAQAAVKAYIAVNEALHDIDKLRWLNLVSSHWQRRSRQPMQSSEPVLVYNNKC